MSMMQHGITPPKGYSGMCICVDPSCPGIPTWMLWTMCVAWGVLAGVAPLFFVFMAFKIVVGP